MRWTDRLLAVMALVMAWQPAATLQDAFEGAWPVLTRMYGSRRRPGKTLAGYLKAIYRASPRMLGVIGPHLRQKVQQVARRSWRWRRWVVLAVDGSRVECPRTAANEKALHCAGRHKTGPQLSLTTIFHVGSGLPWDYRRGAGIESERNHLRDMCPGLPPRSLLLMDAGFTGFDLLRSLTEASHDFIVRVGANITLLRKLGYFTRQHEGIVHLWPEAHRHQPPLTLRCLTLKTPGRPVVLLTSLLSPQALSDAEVAGWYRYRWRIEVNFRSLKQTLGKRKMLSDSPGQAKLELDWAVTGLWLLGLAAAEQQRRRIRWSAARALRVVRRAMNWGPRRVPSGGLRKQLRQARMDSYVRHNPRKARDWPHKKNEPPATAPNIRRATRTEIRRAQAFYEQKLIT
jgi:IS4 transposase